MVAVFLDRANFAMRGALAIWLSGLLVTGASAQPPPGYYNPVDATSALTLRSTLHDLIDDHTRFPYTANATDTWDILKLADQDPDDPNRILDVYKNASYPKAVGGNDNYNREHGWPKSYGFKKDGSGNYPYTDCHHLFLADSRYNSSRSNKPYRTCDASCTERATDSNNGQGGATGTYPGNSNWTSTGIWETWVGRRGDVARALFYMDVRYEGGTHGVTNHAEPDLILTDDVSLIQSSTQNQSVAHMGLLSTLLSWHEEDPVDDLERQHNDAVFGAQGNRNPFVDHPEWVTCLFEGVGCEGTEPDDEDELALQQVLERIEEIERQVQELQDELGVLKEEVRELSED